MVQYSIHVGGDRGGVRIYADIFGSSILWSLHVFRFLRVNLYWSKKQLYSSAF
jgi:hypothetical protein